MALIHSLEKSGNFLFRYRGQIPVVLFIIAVPVIYFTDISWMDNRLSLALTILSIIFSSTGFFIRAWTIGTTPKGTSGRNTKEGQVAETLNTGGIYSIVRHPLYLGNYLMWIGIVLFTFNIWFVLLVSLAYWIYYERIMFAEERFLERKFGDDYLSWSQKIPAFLPKLSGYMKSSIPFSLRSVLRREYSGVLATVIGFVFIDHLRYFFETGTFEPNRISTWVLGFAIVITLILRSLKHYTRVLNESGRS
jgi:protein-S-isoprenylcysteine O-methyltransferase Ste14